MVEDRPMVNVYELGADGDEELVYRPMTAVEYEQHLEFLAAVEADKAAPANPILAAVEAMDDGERAALRELLE